MEKCGEDFLVITPERMENNETPEESTNSRNEWFLPTEVWTEIFTHLTAMELLPIRLVCRHFRDIVEDRSLLSKISTARFPNGIDLNDDYEPEFLLPSREARFYKAKLFALGTWWSPFAVGLNELHLCCCEILYTTFLEVLRQTPNLRQLQLEEIKFIEVTSNTRDVKCDQMEMLTLIHIDYELINVFARTFPRLKVLRHHPKWYPDDRNIINWVAAFQDTLEEFGPCGDIELLMAIVRLPRLRLKRVCCNYVISPCTEQLIYISQLQPCIEYLDLEEILVSSETLRTLGRNLRNLKEISFHSDPMEATIEASFLNTMPALESLSISGSNHQSIDFSNSRSPKLKKLILSNVSLTRASWNFLEHSPNTREIDLSNCIFESWWVFSEPINRLRQLGSLTLYHVQVQAKKKDFWLDTQNSLKSLKISNCHLRKNVLAGLLYNCRELQALHLYEIMTLNDEIALKLCQELKCLKRLIIQRCWLTKATVTQVIYCLQEKVEGEINGVNLR